MGPLLYFDETQNVMLACTHLLANSHLHLHFAFRQSKAKLPILLQILFELIVSKVFSSQTDYYYSFSDKYQGSFLKLLHFFSGF